MIQTYKCGSKMKWLVIMLITAFSCSCSSNEKGEVVEVTLDLKEENDTVTCNTTVASKVKYAADTVKVNVKSLKEYELKGNCRLNDNSGDNDIIISGFNKNDDGNYFSKNNPIAGKNGEDRIICNFRLSCTECPIKEKSAKCIIKLDVRFQRESIPGYIYANLDKLNTTLETDNKLFYDYLGEYKFFDGKPTTFLCKRYETVEDKKPLKINLYIYNNKGESVRHFTGLNSLDIYVKLTSDYDGGYIDCRFGNLLMSYVDRIQLTMEKQKETGFGVNGLHLIPHLSKSEYRYYAGEDLDIVTYNNGKIYEEAKCNLTENHKELNTSLGTLGEGVIHFTPKENYTNLELMCNYNGHQHYLDLIPNVFGNPAFYMTGISMANILIKHHNKAMNLITINYEYNEKKGLNVSCYSSTEIPSLYTGYDTNKNFKNVTNSTTDYKLKFLELKANENVTNNMISCNDSKEKITIFLIPGNKSTQQGGSYSINGNHDVFRTDLEKPRSLNPMGQGTGITKTPGRELKSIVIGAGVALIVIIFVVVWAVYYTLNRRKRIRSVQNEATDINYENLPAHKEGPMPMPKQWSTEAQYATPLDLSENHNYAQVYKPSTVEELYTQPLPKQKRPKPNAEPGYESMNDVAKYPKRPATAPKPCKVQVAPLGIEAAYAQIMKKSERLGGTNANLSTINHVPEESPYAEVALSEASYAEANASSYAGSICSENPYAEPNCGTLNKYENVLDNQRYVNTNAKDDYAQPAYCEIYKNESKQNKK